MERLIAAQLRYGDLLALGGKTLIGRYNRALEILCGRQTNLETFSIDMTGFSPQVAEEFGDPLYLNPHGINRKFILLTVDQDRLPVVEANFSWTAPMMRRFIGDNRDQLFALTSRDVVYGELENSTYRLKSLEDLLSIRQIRFDVNSSRKLLTRAGKLERLIDDYRADDMAWRDEDKLDAIIALAETTGDILRHPLDLSRTSYGFGNFHTRHFGGLYVFGNAAAPTLVGADPNLARRVKALDTPMDHVSLRNAKAVREFLGRNRLVEYAKADRPEETLRRLREVADLILIDFLAGKGLADDLRSLGGERQKRFVYEHFDNLPKPFHAMSKVIKHMEQTGGSLPARIPDEAFFYITRPSDHEDADLVGHLLANFTPLDFPRTYRANRALFYQQYEGWPDVKKDFVAAYLAKHEAKKRAPRRRKAHG